MERCSTCAISSVIDFTSLTSPTKVRRDRRVRRPGRDTEEEKGRAPIQNDADRGKSSATTGGNCQLTGGWLPKPISEHGDEWQWSRFSERVNWASDCKAPEAVPRGKWVKYCQNSAKAWRDERDGDNWHLADIARW